MQVRERREWEERFCREIERKLGELECVDASHDLAHVKRVVQTAQRLCQTEGGELWVVTPAAWFHDYVVIPKHDARRARASQLSAKEALEFLSQVGYPSRYFSSIAHAIEAHSFSAQIECKTLEAGIVQDADRLDALGAIGLARLFNTSGQMGSQLYEESDPFAQQRALNDRRFAVDHIFKKLYPMVSTFQTKAGRREGELRRKFLEGFIQQLSEELRGEVTGLSEDFLSQGQEKV